MLSITCLPQEVLVEPEFNDVVFKLDAGKLIELERETSAIQGKSAGFIVINTKAVRQFSGAKSPVRLAPDQPIEFVVRTPFASPTFHTDPSSLYPLRKLDEKKKSRELLLNSGRATPVGASIKTSAQAPIPVKFSRYGTSSFKITSSALPPSQAAFCFGVD
jgi:hypothetical protein